MNEREPQAVRELNLAAKASDYVRGDLALTSDGLRLLLLDLAEALAISGRKEIRDGRAV